MNVKEALNKIGGNRVKIYSIPNEYGGSIMYYQGEKQYLSDKMLNKECKYVKYNNIYIDKIPEKSKLNELVF